MRAVTRQGVTWRVTEPDVPSNDSFWDLWEGGDWEQETLDVIERYVPKDGLFLDVGAFVGALSLWAVRGGAHAIAIEPDPAAYAALVSNVEANVPPGEVTSLHAALTLTDEPAVIAEHSAGWGSSLTHLAAVNAEPAHGDSGVVCSVAGMSVETVLGERVPSFVKVDIEGGECLVCEQLGPYCAERGVPLLVSLHKYAWTRPLDPAWFEGFDQVLHTRDQTQRLFVP